MSYTKDEALWYAVNQMRRAARTFEIVQVKGDRTPLVEIYAKGLDLCADECEKTMDQDELKRMRTETHDLEERVLPEKNL